MSLSLKTRPAILRKTLLWYLTAYHQLRNRGPTLSEIVDGLSIRHASYAWSVLQSLVTNGIVWRNKEDKTYLVSWPYRSETLKHYETTNATFPDSSRVALTPAMRFAIYSSPMDVSMNALADKYNVPLAVVKRIRRPLVCRQIAECVVCGETVYAKGLCRVHYRRQWEVNFNKRKGRSAHRPGKGSRLPDGFYNLLSLLDVNLTEYAGYVLWLGERNSRGVYLDRLDATDWVSDRQGRGPAKKEFRDG